MSTGDGHSQLVHWLVGHVPGARQDRVSRAVEFRPLSRFEGAPRAPTLDGRSRPSTQSCVDVAPPTAGPRPLAGCSTTSLYPCRCRPPGRHMPFENCTANTSIFINCRCICNFQATKSQRWMPWRLLPKKDVGGCEKPRKAADRATTRGCPNGETRHPSWGVTPV